MSLPRQHTWNCLYFGNDVDCVTCHPQLTCKNCGHTVSEHSYSDEPAAFGSCPGCRGCGPKPPEVGIMLGKRGSAHHDGGRHQDTVVFVPCLGGCGTRVVQSENGFNLCSACQPRLASGSASCIQAQNPGNEDVAR